MRGGWGACRLAYEWIWRAKASWHTIIRATPPTHPPELVVLNWHSFTRC